MNWKEKFQHLETENILLEPLEDQHIPVLLKLAEPHPEIWEFYTFDGTKPERLKEMLETFLRYKKEGKWFPFVVILKQTNTIIGSTALIDLDETNRKLEIGATWYSPEFWGTSVNPECKYALLSFCFETLKTVRVYIKTDEKNIRSQKAIEKIGARYEGTFRNDMIRDYGVKRNSKYYSIIDGEWKNTKEHLLTLIQNSKKLLHRK